VRPRAGLLELDEWDWRRALDVNLTGVFLAMQSVGRVMRELGGGVMLNVVSEPNQVGENISLAYQAAAAGITGLTRAAAGELAPHNIRVNGLRLAGGVSEAFLDRALELCRPSNKQSG
jgi:3-oxoacyl-[acyl-carrier protein] reductase